MKLSLTQVVAAVVLFLVALFAFSNLAIPANLATLPALAAAVVAALGVFFMPALGELKWEHVVLVTVVAAVFALVIFGLTLSALLAVVVSLILVLVGRPVVEVIVDTVVKVALPSLAN